MGNNLSMQSVGVSLLTWTSLNILQSLFDVQHHIAGLAHFPKIAFRYFVNKQISGRRYLQFLAIGQRAADL